MWTYVIPISVLSATIIGAGIFSLPYVFSEAGFLIGIGYLFVFGFAVSLVHLMYADIIIRTDREPKFVDYARIYLGEWSFLPAVFLAVFGALFGNTIYLVLAPKFTSLVFSGANELAAIILFWSLGAIAIFFNVKLLGIVEVLVNAGMFFIVGILFVLGLRNIMEFSFFRDILSGVDFRSFFLPFGPVLFSLYGRSAIPSLLESFDNMGVFSKINASIWGGTLFPAMLYGLFVVGVLGLSPEVSKDAVSGLASVSGALLVMVGIFGLLALYSTYIVIGIAVKDILQSDLRVSHPFSVSLVIFTPILIYFFGLRDFLQLVSISGGVFTALEILFILGIWRKLNVLQKPKALFSGFSSRIAYAIAPLFIFGLCYELYFIFY